MTTVIHTTEEKQRGLGEHPPRGPDILWGGGVVWKGLSKKVMFQSSTEG